MNSKIYPTDLAKFVDTSKYIPRKIKSSKDIKKYSRYISLEQATDGFKIEDIIEIDDDIYYQVRFLLTGRQAVIPYEETFTYYELIPDKTSIRKLPTIINSNEPYFGSEIKYWFFINNINLDSDKYYNFKSLITESKHMISDNKLYYMLATYLPLKDKFVDCRAVLFK